MQNRQRYIELDLLRTVAILGMIAYHTAYDLQMFYGWNIDVFSSTWKIIQLATASLFLLLVGVTSSFSNRHPLQRFLRIGSAALLVSVVTYVIDSETYVRFGVLHLISVAAILIPIIIWSCGRAIGTSLSQSIVILMVSITLIAASPWIASFHSNTYLLLPIGITYSGFMTVDYFPLIPWFGIILIGNVLGLHWTQWMHKVEHSLFSWPGKHSLLLYLIHQPIIMGILWMLLGRPAF